MTTLSLEVDSSQRPFAFVEWYVKTRVLHLLLPMLLAAQLALRVTFQPIEAVIARFVMLINFTLMFAFWPVTVGLIISDMIGPGIPALLVLGLAQMVVLTAYQYRQVTDLRRPVSKKLRPPAHLVARAKKLLVFYGLMTGLNVIAILAMVAVHTHWSIIDWWCVILSALVCCLVFGVLELKEVENGDKWRFTFAIPRVVTQIAIAAVSLYVGVASPWALSAFFLAFALARLVGNRLQHKQQQTTSTRRMVQIEKLNLLTAILLLTEGVAFAL